MSEFCKKCGGLNTVSLSASKPILFIVQRSDLKLIAKALSPQEWPFLKSLAAAIANER